MRLKSNYITQIIDNTQFLVGVGNDSFKGLVKSNATAAMIVDCLKEDTTVDKITDALYERYDAPRERILTDVERIVNALREIGAIEE